MFTPLMKSLLYLLYGVSPMYPMTFVAVLITLLLATVGASYLPARRVSAVDPVQCMKAE